MVKSLFFFLFFASLISVFGETSEKFNLKGEVVDADTGIPLQARVYVRSSRGKWYFVKSESIQGSAIEYARNYSSESEEIHTTVSAHPFGAKLPPGCYTIRVERGKEYFPEVMTVDIGVEMVSVKFRLKRWINMAEKGWYSGDTHVHRTLDEMPNVLLSEDLNVALPLSYWAKEANTSPAEGQALVEDKCLPVDAAHVACPMNTEYEIFNGNPDEIQLGAFFILGHKTPFTKGVPPVAHIAELAHKEGALLDLDKHSWPWSLMLVPVAKVDLFELSNNHVWETNFGLTKWTLDMAPAYMNLKMDDKGFTEWGWIDFGFQTYYALLNCGFRIWPTAGTASGVHPVPLGFGRVYVYLPDGFSYKKWMQGLGLGHSFVSTGPMLEVQVNGRLPGSTILQKNAKKYSCRVSGLASSCQTLRPIEIIVNGQVVRKIPAENLKNQNGAYESRISEEIELDASSWIVVRAFEDRTDGRIRFAHSSPVYIDVPGKPLLPRLEEIRYMVTRMNEELERNKNMLQPEALKEYGQALEVYKDVEARVLANQ